MKKIYYALAASIITLCSFGYATNWNFKLFVNTSKTENVDLIAKKIKHIAYIADGNRRWAAKQNLNTFEGHRKGFMEVAPKILEESWKLGIHTTSIWCFSTENWNRSENEINYLMEIFNDFVNYMVSKAQLYKTRIIHLGRKNKIPKKLQDSLNQAEIVTRENKEHVLNIMIDHGGQDDILRACNLLIHTVKKGNLVTKEIFENALDTSGQPYPNPDLVIRTSGERRISGFMLWQMAYAEWYFEKSHFPALTLDIVKKAIIDFGQRQRRKGK